jgi:hypothetical protein
MHWEWKNYPFAWQGQYSGHAEGCTVILEAVASQDLWIWHSFFGMAGSHNDINVLQRSPMFGKLADGNVIRLKCIYNFLCSMLVYAPFALCFVTLRGVFMHFPELTY